jgi:hypothetical protein
MAHNLWMVLSAKPKDARPIKAHFNGGKDDPTSISLPVLPAIRGRVIDTEGRPVPDAAVGRWLTFDTDGTGEMLQFFDGAVALTDRAGNFVIAPTLELSFGSSRPAPTIGVLCFADPSFKSDGWLLFHPNRPIRTAVQLFDPNRPVEPMIVTLKPSRLVRIPISREFVTSKRKRIITVRERVWDGRDLPFRVLLDRPDPNHQDGSTGEGNGTTIKRYSVTGFPSLFLIDRDGTMIGAVDHSNHDRLESLVRDLVEKAERGH